MLKVQFNLHRYNKDTLIPTLTLMDKLGVHKTRIVRLEETSRLKKNLKDASMGVEEYFEYMLGIIKQYYELDCNMVLPKNLKLNNMKLKLQLIIQ